MNVATAVLFGLATFCMVNAGLAQDTTATTASATTTTTPTTPTTTTSTATTTTSTTTPTTTASTSTTTSTTTMSTSTATTTTSTPTTTSTTSAAATTSSPERPPGRRGRGHGDVSDSDEYYDSDYDWRWSGVRGGVCRDVPVHYGSCLGSVDAWSYVGGNTCVAFTFSGCGSSANVFASEYECIRRCGITGARREMEWQSYVWRQINLY